MYSMTPTFSLVKHYFLSFLFNQRIIEIIKAHTKINGTKTTTITTTADQK